MNWLWLSLHNITRLILELRANIPHFVHVQCARFRIYTYMCCWIEKRMTAKMDLFQIDHSKLFWFFEYKTTICCLNAIAATNSVNKKQLKQQAHYELDNKMMCMALWLFCFVFIAPIGQKCDKNWCIENLWHVDQFYVKQQCEAILKWRKKKTKIDIDTNLPFIPKLLIIELGIYFDSMQFFCYNDSQSVHHSLCKSVFFLLLLPKVFLPGNIQTFFLATTNTPLE